MYNLNGKVALVTGCGGQHGIGRAIALKLAQNGADVVINDIVPQRLDSSEWAGLPAAMGAKCAQPNRPVLCFTGDGGIWYHLSELETARRCGINIVTVVNNNHSWNQEQGGVEGTYGGRTSGSDELWLFEDADFARIAESMGCLGLTVNRLSELSSALDQAFAADKPAVVDVKTHIEGIAPQAWTPA